MKSDTGGLPVSDELVNKTRYTDDAGFPVIWYLH